MFQAQAEIEPKGSSQGKTNGQYALPLEPESKAYIEQHGIPYGSWRVLQGMKRLLHDSAPSMTAGNLPQVHGTIRAGSRRRITGGLLRNRSAAARRLQGRGYGLVRLVPERIAQP